MGGHKECNCNGAPFFEDLPTLAIKTDTKKSFWWANYFLQNSDNKTPVVRGVALKNGWSVQPIVKPNCIIKKWQHSKLEEKMEGQKLDQSDWDQKTLSLYFVFNMFSNPTTKWKMASKITTLHEPSWTKLFKPFLKKNTPPVQCPALPPWYQPGFDLAWIWALLCSRA